MPKAVDPQRMALMLTEIKKLGHDLTLQHTPSQSLVLRSGRVLETMPLTQVLPWLKGYHKALKTCREETKE